jgi:hypothetical protein
MGVVWDHKTNDAMILSTMSIKKKKLCTQTYDFFLL